MNMKVLMVHIPIKRGQQQPMMPSPIVSTATGALRFAHPLAGTNMVIPARLPPQNMDGSPPAMITYFPAAAPPMTAAPMMMAPMVRPPMRPVPMMVTAPPPLVQGGPIVQGGGPSPYGMVFAPRTAPVYTPVMFRRGPQVPQRQIVCNPHSAGCVGTSVSTTSGGSESSEERIVSEIDGSGETIVSERISNPDRLMIDPSPVKRGSRRKRLVPNSEIKKDLLNNNNTPDDVDEDDTDLERPSPTKKKNRKRKRLSAADRRARAQRLLEWSQKWQAERRRNRRMRQAPPQPSYERKEMFCAERVERFQKEWEAYKQLEHLRDEYLREGYNLHEEYSHDAGDRGVYSRDDYSRDDYSCDEHSRHEDLDDECSHDGYCCDDLSHPIDASLLNRIGAFLKVISKNSLLSKESLSEVLWMRNGRCDFTDAAWNDDVRYFDIMDGNVDNISSQDGSQVFRRAEHVSRLVPLDLGYDRLDCEFGDPEWWSDARPLLPTVVGDPRWEGEDEEEEVSEKEVFDIDTGSLYLLTEELTEDWMTESESHRGLDLQTLLDTCLAKGVEERSLGRYPTDTSFEEVLGERYRFSRQEEVSNSMGTEEVPIGVALAEALLGMRSEEEDGYVQMQ